MKKLLVFLCLAGAAIPCALGQNRQYATISGFVYDAANGEALIGANVYLEKTQIGGSTNSSGYFVIPRIPFGQYALVVHYLGYQAHVEEISLAAGI